MSGNIDRFRDDFFQSGEAFITGVLEQVERLFGPIAPGRAMDFGCGVGRLALPLARRFRSATGVDISASMLAEAARNAARAGLGNLDWVLSDERLTRVEGPFDFINSYIVLQHIPPHAGMRLIARLLDLVAPGGARAAQLSAILRPAGPLRSRRCR
jgi:2-polyprenyl-3-methyl-5-hydroxy-6-metoxy-1,4-benzoquinol methylase